MAVHVMCSAVHRWGGGGGGGENVGGTKICSQAH